MIIDDDDFTNQLESDKAIMSQQTLAGADRQFYNIVTTVFYTII